MVAASPGLRCGTGDIDRRAGGFARPRFANDGDAGSGFDHAFAQQNALAVANLWPNLERTIRADNPNIDAGTLAELQREFEKIRLARLHEIVKDLPTIYARHLTAEQMREIAAFYRSPTGQRMLQVLPSVMTEGFALVLPRMRIVTDDSQEMFLKLLLERGLIKAVRDR